MPVLVSQSGPPIARHEHKLRFAAIYPRAQLDVAGAGEDGFVQVRLASGDS